MIPAKGTGDVDNWTRLINYVRTHPDSSLFPHCLNYRCGIFYPATYPPGHFLVVYVLGRIAPVNINPHILFKITIFSFYLLGLAVLLAFHPGLITPLVYLGLPSLIINSQGLGYTDVFFLPQLIGSLLLLSVNRNFYAGLLFGLACFIKWQPAILLPLILVYLFFSQKAKNRLFKPGIFFTGMIVPQLILIWFKADPVTSLKLFLSGALNDPILSSALNIPWLITVFLKKALNATSVIPQAYFLSFEKNHPYYPIMFLGRISYLLIYWAILRRFAGLLKKEIGFNSFLLTGQLVFFSYFMISPGVHENHFYIPLILSLLLFLRNPNRPTLILLLMSELFNFTNLAFFYGLTGIPIINASENPLISIILTLIFVLVYFQQAQAYFTATASSDEPKGRLKKFRSLFSLFRIP